MKRFISAKKQTVFFFGWTALLCLWFISENQTLAQESGEQKPQAVWDGPRSEFSGWLTNNGSYLRKIYCMQKPDGTPDWGFIIPSAESLCCRGISGGLSVLDKKLFRGGKTGPPQGADVSGKYLSALRHIRLSSLCNHVLLARIPIIYFLSFSLIRCCMEFCDPA